jgi:hypothetical protein
MYLKRGRALRGSSIPSNPNATREAKSLYARLCTEFGAAGGSARRMFIGVNETAAAVPYYTRNGDHIASLTGKTPLLRHYWPVAKASQGYTELVAAVKDHYRKGGICATIWHPKNYITGGNNYDRPRDDWEPVIQCLSPSGSQLAAYRADLDGFADMLNNDLRDDAGRKIPFIVRIFNEINGWADYPDMSVTSLTRSGNTATLHFSKGGNTIHSQWSNPGAKFQIRGAIDTKWNTIFNISSFVLDGDGLGGTVTFTVTSNPTSNPGGTITCNALAGDWWAGLDRSADVLTLARQTIDYLRDVKGCDQLIWSCDIFTNNRLAASMDPNTYPYTNWLTGMDSYWDVVGSNLYQDEPTSWGYCDFGATQVVSAFDTLVAWAEARQRPVMFHEFGARYDGRETTNFWGTRCMKRFDALYPKLIGACTWTLPTFLPTPGVDVAVADFASAMSNPRYVWRPQ